jgi:putative hydrolase of the HAD superfamily
MAPEALIFDFDGLLMGTETSSLTSWQYEWRQHGLELDVRTFFADHGGDITQERYARLAAAVGPAYAQAASHTRRLAYRDELNAGLGLLPGIASWLDRARELDLRLAIASSSPRAWVVRHLRGAGYLDRFELLACGDEVGRAKPDPAVYQLAVQRLGVAPERAIAIEDSPHGAAAARAAGLTCVAIPNPYADPAKFTAAHLTLESAAHASLDEILAACERDERPHGRRDGRSTDRPANQSTSQSTGQPTDQPKPEVTGSPHPDKDLDIEPARKRLT